MVNHLDGVGKSEVCAFAARRAAQRWHEGLEVGVADGNAQIACKP